MPKPKNTTETNENELQIIAETLAEILKIMKYYHSKDLEKERVLQERLRYEEQERELLIPQTSRLFKG